MNYSDTKQNRINLAKAIPLPKPFTLLFEPICACNFRCSHCYYSLPDIRNVMSRGKMRTEDFNKILSDLQAWEGEKIKVIRIIGFGEPLLHPDVGQWINLISDSKVAERIEITTNASLLNVKIARQLVEGQLDYLRVSIYATRQERFEAVTRSNIDMGIIRDNLLKLQCIKKELGSDKPFVYVKMLDNQDDKENEEFFSMYSDVADEIALEKKHNWLKGNPDRRKICPQPFKMLSIRWNGNCIVCDPDFHNNTYIGNALTSSVREIWEGPELYTFRKLHIEGRKNENKSCRNCSFLNEEYVFDNIDEIDVSCLDKKEL